MDPFSGERSNRLWKVQIIGNCRIILANLAHADKEKRIVSQYASPGLHRGGGGVSLHERPDLRSIAGLVRPCH
jgi:hypothetical protein